MKKLGLFIFALALGANSVMASEAGSHYSSASYRTVETGASVRWATQAPVKDAVAESEAQTLSTVNELLSEKINAKLEARIAKLAASFEQ
ncbi:hypothetical protein [Marinibactrum halimedae]|uniref:Uncharacterized protein n=1 Tax=Marinibactrum halimedae TaxID=1444977 RepID=A0AA37WKU0_9GAMM|nr:hypothetical protein [Marinibactrum halimedae]MCD9460915.1 hypothetical protein [Marinibactrum halimedae]GLS24590.1 hypothetical protein GCM10007877_03040 [Marinibactrum halimedae]